MPTAWWEFLRPAVVLAWSRRRKQLTLPRAYRVWLILVLSTFVCIGLMRIPAAANLVQNGDFSTGDLSGWSALQLGISGNFGGELTQVLIGPIPNPTVEATCFVFTHGCGAFIFTDAGWGAIVQTLVTVPGQSYRVQFVVVVLGGDDRGGRRIGEGGFVAVFNGIGYMGADPLVDGGFPPFVPLPPGSDIRGNAFFGGAHDDSFVATATGNLTAIEFAGTCPGCSFLVTDVSVDPIVPEPPTFFLFAAGLLATWISVRRGRHRTR
jgi:hypothetical protein